MQPTGKNISNYLGVSNVLIHKLLNTDILNCICIYLEVYGLKAQIDVFYFLSLF